MGWEWGAMKHTQKFKMHFFPMNQKCYPLTQGRQEGYYISKKHLSYESEKLEVEGYHIKKKFPL